jgi:hypothetical protein
MANIMVLLVMMTNQSTDHLVAPYARLIVGEIQLICSSRSICMHAMSRAQYHKHSLWRRRLQHLPRSPCATKWRRPYSTSSQVAPSLGQSSMRCYLWSDPRLNNGLQRMSSLNGGWWLSVLPPCSMQGHLIANYVDGLVGLETIATWSSSTTCSQT